MDGRNLRLVGILTWGVILFTSGGSGGPFWYVLMFVFVAGFVAATYRQCPPTPRRLLNALQALAALGAMALVPHLKMEPVLLVIIAGELGGLETLPALAWIFAQTAGLAVIAGGLENSILLPYIAFQLFAYFAVRIAHREAMARQALAEANAELKVTSGLLDLSSRTEERLRIARDLHDLLGHHLTALSLNLEVASHLASGEAKASVEKSQAITKDLLADVRTVVSRLREDEPVDLATAINALSDVITTPALHVDFENVAISDPAVAQVALRAVQEIVTNAVRHSGARNLWLRLSTSDHTLDVDARDDGAGTDRVEFGNGLRGIRERVEQVKGRLEVSSMRGRGFSVHISLPA
ncbi:MAG TPA: sensor histidine kinase [Thermoanaerobaculia bacterium]|jgi:signal transduction histidine kinase